VEVVAARSRCGVDVVDVADEAREVCDVREVEVEAEAERALPWLSPVAVAELAGRGDL
jgi:hypothetical protein